MKARERDRLSVLRMLKSRIVEKEVELRGQKGRDYLLSDEETLEVLSGYAKQRRQSIDSYRQGGREDLARKEEAELGILQEYLPRQLSASELESIISEAIQETGASTQADFGRVMRETMSRVKGAADGRLVGELVRKKLQT